VSTKRAQGDGELAGLLAFPAEEARRTADARAEREAKAREAAEARAAGKARQRANLLDPTVHGAYIRRGSYRRCGNCTLMAVCEQWVRTGTCARERRFVAEERRRLREEPGITRADWPDVEELVWLQVRLARAQVAEACGWGLQAGGRIKRLNRDVTRWMNRHSDLLVKLGLTPLQRKRDPEGIARRTQGPPEKRGA